MPDATIKESNLTSGERYLTYRYCFNLVIVVHADNFYLD